MSEDRGEDLRRLSGKFEILIRLLLNLDSEALIDLVPEAK